MSSLLSSIDQMTKLAGENRLELLIFQLGTSQLYGINVFKVKEIVEQMPLTIIPTSNNAISGLVSIRGNTVPVLDLSLAIGYAPTKTDKYYIIVTEYNQSVQGFLATNVSRIINLDWAEINTLPPGSGSDHYLTAITKVDNHLVEIIDVEKILQAITPLSQEINKETIEAMVDVKEDVKEEMSILICDDSKIARTQLVRALKEVGLKIVQATNGREAYDYLKQQVAKGYKQVSNILLVISDIEMPEMDGYKLTTEIKSNKDLKDLHIILHSSLSGVFNNALVEKVGADSFIAKFDPNIVLNAVNNRLKAISSNK